MEIVDNEIKRQKYYNEYDNEYTAAQKAESADYVAVIAIMIANIWTLNNDEAKTFIKAIGDMVNTNGLRKDIIAIIP